MPGKPIDVVVLGADGARLGRLLLAPRNVLWRATKTAPCVKVADKERRAQLVRGEWTIRLGPGDKTQRKMRAA
jgi:hypothetical protein